MFTFEHPHPTLTLTLALAYIKTIPNLASVMRSHLMMSHWIPSTFPPPARSIAIAIAHIQTQPSHGEAGARGRVAYSRHIARTPDSSVQPVL